MRTKLYNKKIHKKITFSQFCYRRVRVVCLKISHNRVFSEKPKFSMRTLPDQVFLKSSVKKPLENRNRKTVLEVNSQANILRDRRHPTP